MMKMLTGILLAVLFDACVAGRDNLTDSDAIVQPPSLIMNEPDFIIKSPLNSFKLVCRASGFPTPRIRWYKDGTQVTNSMMNKISPDGTLSIIMMDHFRGRYQCQAENVFGIALSNITTVDMAILGDFTHTYPNVLQSTVVNVGDPLELPCSYSDPFSNPQPTWSWVRPNALGDLNPVQTEVTLDGRLSVDDRGTLYFQHVELSDNPGYYYHLCGAWNPILNIKKIGSPARLRIHPGVPVDSPPVLVYQNGDRNNDIEVIEGEPINLYCIFKGRPTVNVLWEKVGRGPKPLIKYQNGKTRAIIEHSKNTEQFEGLYTCTGWQADKALKAVGYFYVNVLQKPRFIEGPVNVNLTEGTHVMFTCRAEAEPDAVITWFINGQPASSLPRHDDRTVGQNRLTILNLRRGNGPEVAHSQVVTCMARNERRDGTEVGRAYLNGYINVVRCGAECH